jgi:hypothetical protein
MDAKMWAAIMDENPGTFGHDVGRRISRRQGTFSTMPGLLLAEIARGCPTTIQVSFCRSTLDPLRRSGEHNHGLDARRDPMHTLRLNEVGARLFTSEHREFMDQRTLK